MINFSIEYPHVYEYISSLEGFDPTYSPVYYNEWNTYEEYGWILILERNDSYYIVRGGHCVMTNNNKDIFSPEKVSFEEAFMEMNDFEEYLNVS